MDGSGSLEASSPASYISLLPHDTFPKLHLPPVNVGVQGTASHQTWSSSTSSMPKSNSDQLSNERQMLLMYLLSQVCTMKDPTPTLFGTELLFHFPVNDWK